MSAQPARQTTADAFVERLLAADPEGASQLIATYSCDDWDETVRVLTERVWQEVRVDTHRADRFADAAIEISIAHGSPTSYAKSLRAKANSLYALDQHAAAIDFHRQAADLFEQSGNDHELARTLSGSIQPLLLLGRYDEALANGERARALFQRLGNTHRQARLEINIGNIYHRQDRFTEALSYYERSYQELLRHDDAEGLAAVLSNLSLCYITLNDFPKALGLHRIARQHCEQKGMPTLVAYADYNIAYLYFLRGEYGRAIKMLRDASLSAKKADDAYQLALCNLDLSELYLELNLNAEAGELGRIAHEAFLELGFGYEGAKALAFTAIAASRSGQAFEGIKLFSQSREMFVRDQNLVWPALIDLYQGLVYFNEARLFEARRLCEAANKFFQHSPMRSKSVLARLLLARIALRLSDTKLAAEHCRTALDNLASFDAPNLLYQAEFLMGEIQRAAGNDEQAYESYSRARESLERLRSNLFGDDLKMSFFENKLEVYENLVALCLRRPGGDQESFGYIEHAKSRALMDVLSQSVHVPAAGDTSQSDLVRTIRNCREELNWYYNLIEREQLRPEKHSQQRLERMEQEARTREADLTRALKEATITEAQQAGVQLPTTFSLDEIRAALPTGTILVEYFRVQDRILACTLSRDQFEIAPVTIGSRTQNLLQLLQFQMAKFRLDPQYLKTFAEPIRQATEAHLRNLYQELLAPIQNRLTAHHLVFIPHGPLHYVPFHALHDGQSYLIDRHTVSYAPSASIYALCRGKSGQSTGDSLIMGIPDAQAPSIQTEVETLASLLPGSKLFVGSAATEAVLRTHGRTSRLIHIATHGYFRQDNPLFSSIRLGDSHLSLYDIYHLELPAELMVLSGCATGLNVISPGDELMGLVRGLLQAGAQSLILSLWDVHDKSTMEFMLALYTELLGGRSKPEAMQAAMIKIRNSYPHPYYWAPFSLIGKG
jgi:CHAT domain-containing protein